MPASRALFRHEKVLSTIHLALRHIIAIEPSDSQLYSIYAIDRIEL